MPVAAALPEDLKAWARTGARYPWSMLGIIESYRRADRRDALRMLCWCLEAPEVLPKHSLFMDEVSHLSLCEPFIVSELSRA